MTADKLRDNTQYAGGVQSAESGVKRTVPVYKRLYPQVLFALLAGVLLGYFFPDAGAQMKPLGDAFIKIIKMMIAPVIFITVSVGIAKMGDLKEVGRVGIKALIYFEVMTTIALFLGLIVVNVYKP